jgi:sporulation protein YlmC with PRC-barrel domain
MTTPIHRALATTGLATAATVAAAAAFAQESAQEGESAAQQPAQEAADGQQQAEASPEVDIELFDPTAIYDGWSADALLDEDALNQRGEVVGEVEDLIVGPDGRIQRVVVEGGGFLDIGDVHAALPWDIASRTADDELVVEINEDDIDDYTRFPNVDDMPAAPENFRIRELIGDYMTAQGRGYGTVDDVIFSEEGRIEAVVVFPAYGYGYRRTPVAVPYDPDAYGPAMPYYETDYGTAELDELRPFDYGEFD